MDYWANNARRWWFVFIKNLKSKMFFAGVDFGAKMSGNTAITFQYENCLLCFQSVKGQDTDEWLINLIKKYSISTVYIDAPLSLPGAYFGIEGDFSYRQADRALSAMSPMFLGGLTARAMKLSAMLSDVGVYCIVVYPGGFIRQNAILKTFYDKKNLSSLLPMFEAFSSLLPFQLKVLPNNYHQLDSLICWYIGYRHINNIAISFGNPKEGLIWI